MARFDDGSPRPWPQRLAGTCPRADLAPAGIGGRCEPAFSGGRLIFDSGWPIEEGMSQTMMTSRAVERPIEAGNSAVCVHCHEPVKFVARAHLRQVIANVYVDGAWDRVEHFHSECYELAERPYGEPAV